MTTDGNTHDGDLLLLLRTKDLRAHYGLAPATIYRWIAKGDFPRPIPIGNKSVAWHREEIEAWRRTRPRTPMRDRSPMSNLPHPP
jgi:prophage regulatory protein